MLGLWGGQEGPLRERAGGRVEEGSKSSFARG